MEFKKNKFYYQTNFSPSALKERKGFISILLLPLIALMMTGVMGLTSLSMGIKNITKAQSYCFQSNLQGQKELGAVMKKLLKLNGKVLFLHKVRKQLEIAMTSFLVSGALNVAFKLKQKINKLKQAQRLLIMRQNYLIKKSENIKNKALRSFKKQLSKLKSSHIREDNSYKKALALTKIKQGDLAFTYKPVSDFVNKQKIRFSWKLKPFFPLDKNKLWLLKRNQKSWSDYTCTASLEKKGMQWTPILYH